jgi:hypothetical protein
MVECMRARGSNYIGLMAPPRDIRRPIRLGAGAKPEQGGEQFGKPGETGARPARRKDTAPAHQKRLAIAD